MREKILRVTPETLKAEGEELAILKMLHMHSEQVLANLTGVTVEEVEAFKESFIMSHYEGEPCSERQVDTKLTVAAALDIIMGYPIFAGGQFWASMTKDGKLSLDTIVDGKGIQFLLNDVEYSGKDQEVTIELNPDDGEVTVTGNNNEKIVDIIGGTKYEVCYYKLPRIFIDHLKYLLNR